MLRWGKQSCIRPIETKCDKVQWQKASRVNRDLLNMQRSFRSTGEMENSSRRKHRIFVNLVWNHKGNAMRYIWMQTWLLQLCPNLDTWFKQSQKIKHSLIYYASSTPLCVFMFSVRAGKLKLVEAYQKTAVWMLIAGGRCWWPCLHVCLTDFVLPGVSFL